MTASDRRIALVEAAYNLEVAPQEWLPNLLRAGGEILSLGQGCAGAIVAGTTQQGEPLVSQVHTENADQDLATRLARAAQDVDRSFAEASPAPQPTMIHTLAEARRSHPKVHAALTTHLGCKDMLALWAMDADVHGVGIHIPSSRLIELDRNARRRWQVLSTHIGAGHRLRRRLGDRHRGVPLTEITAEGGAVLDPKNLSVAEAAVDVTESDALTAIRSAAVQMDMVRDQLRRGEVNDALRLWEEVVRGRWSVVDWFDTDGRRFILALPNAEHVSDPRGLTEREYQVATQAGTGESCKVIAYNLGISRSRVSALLQGAMRKLGVHTQAQLVIRIRTFLAAGASSM